MYVIADHTSKNNHHLNDDNFHLTNNHSTDSILKQYLSDKINSDALINDIYVHIGGIFIILFLLFGIVIAITKCIEYYKKDEQISDEMNSSLREVPVIRKNTTIRNSLVGSYRSSLDVRFLMESHERRLSESPLISLPTQKV